MAYSFNFRQEPLTSERTISVASINSEVSPSLPRCFSKILMMEIELNQLRPSIRLVIIQAIFLGSFELTVAFTTTLITTEPV